MSVQFDDRANGLSELSAHRGDHDAQRVPLLHDPRLRVLLRATADLSDESQGLLIAVADRLRVVERIAAGATAELY
ncbi:hypothetical protein IU449_01570 [Nocardia higoensis]|uniref:Uncharacterized protein n=1 Tax=Nocardia higoensis TaxID=228599 RepID=A0ABS0D8R3_9NOCA|nr:hypothetical protein [Nocardia higoensis]MBF6353249.1 hypothetical protein [Nocardia higoensis]